MNDHTDAPARPLAAGAASSDTLPSSDAVQTVRSFVANDGRAVRFRAFLEEILLGALQLQDVAARTWLHAGVLEFHFEQLGYIGRPAGPADGRDRHRQR